MLSLVVESFAADRLRKPLLPHLFHHLRHLQRQPLLLRLLRHWLRASDAPVVKLLKAAPKGKMLLGRRASLGLSTQSVAGRCLPAGGNRWPTLGLRLERGRLMAGG